MRAVNYHVDLPYPIIKEVSINKRHAMLLMDGYSGRISELSTVAQYAYHHLKCESNKELAKAIKGIFLVETHHLELLGDCINKLGVDPRYNIYSNRKSVPWHANVINYKNTMQEMILSDIEGEKAAVNYYIQTAEKVEDDKITRLLLRLAEDEKLHVSILSNLYKKFFEKV